MNYNNKNEVQRMQDLIKYGLNEEEVITGGAKPILEYSQKAADGKVYGIIKECQKFYIKVAPNKDTKLVAEDYDYIGGYMNKKENEYGSYALASKQFDLKMMSINEANAKKVEIEQFKPVETSEWQINETKEMRAELNRFRQITNNVAVILKEEKNVLPSEHTLPEAPASNPSEEKVNSPFTDTAVANGDKDFKKAQEDPKKAGHPFDNNGEVSDSDMQSDKKAYANGESETYSEKAQYVPNNSVADQHPSGGKIAKVSEGKNRRCVKLTEEQLLAWNNNKDYMDKSQGTEIGDTAPYTEETVDDVNEEAAVHNTDDQNSPAVGNGEVGDTAPFDKKVNEDTVDVEDAAGMPDEEEDDEEVPFPEVEDGGSYLDFEKDYNDWEDKQNSNSNLDDFDYEIDLDDDAYDAASSDSDFYESRGRYGRRNIQEGGHLCTYDEDGNLTGTNSKDTYRGVPNSIFISHGEWSDPEIYYDGKTLNGTDIEDGLWSMYQEECREDGTEPNENEYEEWANERAQDYLDDVIFGMSESSRRRNRRISETELHDFGKHPAYHQSAMSIDNTKEVSVNGARDWNDDSVASEDFYGKKIGSSAPYDKMIDHITRSIMKQLNFTKKA